jgi:peptide/nickel transport system substrate-binding protein
MHIAVRFILGAVIFLAAAPLHAQGTINDLPRNETLIAENPEGTIKNAGWFNIWAINAGGQSTGLHQLGMDTFWYIDPDKGIDASGRTRSQPRSQYTTPTSPR